MVYLLAGTTFNAAVPILISALCVATLLKVFGRLLRLLQIPHFDHSLSQVKHSLFVVFPLSSSLLAASLFPLPLSAFCVLPLFRPFLN